MSRRRGGRSSRLLGYRLLIAVLLCMNIAVGIFVVRATIPRLATPTAGATVVPNEPSCGMAPAPLQALDTTVERPGLTHEASDPFYYSVRGITLAEIGQQLTRCGQAATGSAFAASTAYVMTWNVNYRTAGDDLCRVDKVAIGLRTRHIYPHWNDSPHAPADVASSWNRFMQHLTTHETGHVTRSKQYATQLLQLLRTLPAERCQTIEQSVNRTANRVAQSLENANREYDITTGHGRTQGAVLQARP